MTTMQEWLDETGVTMTATQVPENPNMSDGMPKGTVHFHVALECEGRAMTTYYSVGPGIVEHAMKGLKAMHRTKYGVPAKPWPHSLLKSVDWQNAVQKFSKDYKPELLDVLQCLHLDFVGVHGAISFEDWAESLGYDTDSRKAESIYNTVLAQSNQFAHTVGSVAFQKFSELEADW
jgi:hypothetical protein